MPDTSPPHGFVRRFHLTKLEHARSNIQHRRLKVATFSDANDPFELLAIAAPVRGHRATRRLLKEFRERQTKEVGLLCFSPTWNEPVMWSHYADSHRGVALGFDVREDLLEAVKYVESRLAFRLDEDANAEEPNLDNLPEDLRNDLFVTKFERWDYEQEVRRFVRLADAERDEEKGIYYWKFDDDMRLREVILGPLAPRQELGPFREIVAAAGLDALVSRARLGFGKFEVRPDGRYPPA